MNPEPAGEDHAYLAGHVRLKDYLDFMATEPIGADALDRRQLANEWREANDYLRELRVGEAGWADNSPVHPLPESLAPLVAQVEDDPIYRRAFETVHTEIGLVDLDRLVVYQKLNNLVHIRRMMDRLGADPSPEDVLRFCLPFDHPTLTPRVARVSSDSFIFISESNDLRFLGAMLFGPEQISNFPASGPITGVIGLAVGYGSNFLNVISIEGRLVLNNGYHRSHALRELGVTRAPCVIQRLTRREELSVAGGGALLRHPDTYLQAPRPPVLKDFFDPNLCQVVPLTPKERHVRVSFTIRDIDMPRA